MFAATELGLFEWVMVVLVAVVAICFVLVIIITGWVMAEWEWRGIFGSGRNGNGDD